MDITLYHNPRCSKSRQALQLLRERGFEPDIIEYLRSPPSVDELDAILKKLNIEPRQLMRKQEADYQANALDDAGLDRKALIEAMVRHPILIKRPIVLANGKAALGRPPENILTIL